MGSLPLNGIKLDDLAAYTQVITDHPEQAMSENGVVAESRGGVNSEICSSNQYIGRKEVVKDFSFHVGEPEELLGDNAYRIPQDYLLGGMAGCMMVGFVASASARKIKLDEVKLTIKGALNLGGFLNVDADAPVSFAEVQFNFAVKCDGSPAQYDEIIAGVEQSSPNYRTISDAV